MELLAMAHSINFVRYTNVQLFSPLEGDCLLKLWSSISLNFSYFWRISIWINFFCRIFLGILYLLQSTSLSLPWEIAHAYLQNPRKILQKKFIHIETLGKSCSSQKYISQKSLCQRVAKSSINGMVPSGRPCPPNSHCLFIFIIMKVFDEVWGPTICLNLALTEICPFGQSLKGPHGRKIRPSFMILVSYDFLKFTEWLFQYRLSIWNLGRAKIKKNMIFVVSWASENQLND